MRLQIVLYYNQAKMMKKLDTKRQEAEIEAMKAKYSLHAGFVTCSSGRDDEGA